MRTLNQVDVARLSAALLAWWESHGRDGIPGSCCPMVCALHRIRSLMLIRSGSLTLRRRAEQWN